MRQYDWKRMNEEWSELHNANGQYTSEYRKWLYRRAILGAIAFLAMLCILIVLPNP